MHVRPSSWYSWLPLWLDDPIPQHPDGLNLQLDDVTGVQVAIHLQAAPTSYRSRPKKIPGIDGLPTRHMRDHLGKRPVNRSEHIGRASCRERAEITVVAVALTNNFSQ